MVIGQGQHPLSTGYGRGPPGNERGVRDMSELLLVKDKVQRALKQVFNIVNVADNGFTVPYESTMCWVEFFEVTDPDSRAFRHDMDLPTVAVLFWAVVALDVNPSDALFKWIATEGQTYDYGAAKAVQRDDGLYNVVFQYNLAGESVDPMEIKNALLSVCTTADQLDEEFISRFGGKRFIDS